MYMRKRWESPEQTVIQGQVRLDSGRKCRVGAGICPPGIRGERWSCLGPTGNSRPGLRFARRWILPDQHLVVDEIIAQPSGRRAG